VRVDGTSMLLPLLAGFSLMAVCVTIHAAGITGALRRIRRIWPPPTRFLASTRLFIFMAAWVVLLHLAEITVWGLSYAWNGAMPDLPSALYFSAVTYTTTGYGDLVLPQGWRLHGGIEALTGILMCSWSTAFFFAVVNRLYETHGDALPRLPGEPK
jgi:hypothetical protein